MPAWVKDEAIWEKATKAFEESYPEGKPDDVKYAIITTIYKNMGGKVKASDLSSSLLICASHAVAGNDFRLAHMVSEANR